MLCSLSSETKRQMVVKVVKNVWVKSLILQNKNILIKHANLINSIPTFSFIYGVFFSCCASTKTCYFYVGKCVGFIFDMYQECWVYTTYSDKNSKKVLKQKNIEIIRHCWVSYLVLLKHSLIRLEMLEIFEVVKLECKIFLLKNYYNISMSFVLCVLFFCMHSDVCNIFFHWK